MSDFLHTLFRGLYPPYIFFVIWGIAERIRSRRWCHFDLLLLCSFLLFDFFAAFQVWMFYGILETQARYLRIALPLCLPFAAEGALAVWNLLKREKHIRLLTLVVVAVLLALDVYSSYKPVVQQYRRPTKRIGRLFSQQAAALIKEDWRPQPKPAGFDQMKCDHYHSGRRPLVQTCDPMRAVGYLCGGQEYRELFGLWGFSADYIATPNREAPLPGYVLLSEIKSNDKTAYIYKLKAEEQ